MDIHGYKHAYNVHKAGAKARNIDFLFDYEEWLQFWIDSGHLHERGNKKGEYCMSRYGDKGPYAINNVFIQSHGKNTIDAHQGIPLSPKHRLQAGAPHKGKPKSPEQRAKMSASGKARWAAAKQLQGNP